LPRKLGDSYASEFLAKGRLNHLFYFERARQATDDEKKALFNASVFRCSFTRNGEKKMKSVISKFTEMQYILNSLRVGVVELSP